MKADLESLARQHLRASAAVKQQLADGDLGSLFAAAEWLAQAFRAGGKLLICGNGGSAADCQHLAAEFVSRLTRDFDRPALPALALTTDSSFLTAYANDIDFAGVFARQVEALGRPGDVLLGISTSGNSPNILRAVQAAQAHGLRTIALTGAAGQLARAADLAIAVPSANTQYIQEAHLTLEHLLCALVEQLLYSASTA